MNCVAAIAGKKTAKKAAAKEHSNKDASRAVKYVSIQQQQLQPFKIPESEMAQMQLEDESLAQCIQTAAKDTAAKNWVMHNGCLHHIRRQRRSAKVFVQLVLPKAMHEKVMESYHDELLAGHCGYFKTAQKIQQWYWWPAMNKDIKEWVAQCPVCQKHNHNYSKVAGKLAPIMATRPFQIMGMDILTDLPKTPRGNIAIVVFTDYYTKWVEAFALEEMTATYVASKLITGVLCRHGAPERIISDRGSQFTSDVF